MQTSQNRADFPCLAMAKKQDGVDKGTTRKTPGSNEGARPPQKEDFEKIHEQNKKEKKTIEGQSDI